MTKCLFNVNVHKSKVSMTTDAYITNGGNFKPDAEYGTWLLSLKSSYRKSQIKAAVKINSEKLRWNWSVGRDLVDRKSVV